MSKKETQIITKIIRELTLFFMMHGYNTYQMDVDMQKTIAYLTFKINHLDTDILKRLQEKILREREMEVETYGWELLGEGDAKSELEVVGLLIDDLEVRQTSKTTILKFVRKNPEKNK